MQQQLLDWVRQFNQDYANLASLLMVLGLILIVALILHLFLHKILLPRIERNGQKHGIGWQHQLTQHSLFNRIAFVIMLRPHCPVELPAENGILSIRELKQRRDCKRMREQIVQIVVKS